MPIWFTQNYDVWIAHLTTSPLHTPSLEENADCLKQQINQIYNQTGQKVVVVAHSMGGLISRACLSMPDCRNKVEKLYTMGSPHAGFHAGLAVKSLLKMAEGYLKVHGIPLPITDGLCLWQSGVCDMTSDSMVWFNTGHPNQRDIDYTFLGGDTTPRVPLGWSLFPTEGWNDGLTGRYSAVGWVYPSKLFVPPWWDNASPPGQYWTDEVHIRDWGNAYYEMRDNGELSQSYHCIEWRQQGPEANPGYCRDAPSAAPLTIAATPPTLSETTINLEGHLSSGQVVTRTVQVDTANHSLFYLSWIIGTVNFSLIQPGGQVIDPVYAAANPNVVAYSVASGSAEFPPFATYTFTNTQPGLWTLNISPGNVGSAGTDYLAFVAMETDRTLSFTTNADLYNVGSVATFTATLRRGSSGIGGATITAILRRPDNVTNTLTLTHQGNGVYKANYTIPNTPGYIVATIIAQGNDSGTPFTRQDDTLIAIASPTAQLNGSYADYPEDVDGNNLYEAMVFEVGLTASKVGTYTVSANLAKGGSHIANTSVYKVLTTGAQTVALRFNGDDIRNSGLDGPYTISNLIVTDLKKGAIPAVLATNVWTTAAYQHSQFGSGSQKIYLPIILK